MVQKREQERQTNLPEERHSASNGEHGFTDIVVAAGEGVPDAGDRRKKEQPAGEGG